MLQRPSNYFKDNHRRAIKFLCKLIVFANCSVVSHMFKTIAYIYLLLLRIN